MPDITTLKFTGQGFTPGTTYRGTHPVSGRAWRVGEFRHLPTDEAERLMRDYPRAFVSHRMVTERGGGVGPQAHSKDPSSPLSPAKGGSPAQGTKKPQEAAQKPVRPSVASSLDQPARVAVSRVRAGDLDGNLLGAIKMESERSKPRVTVIRALQARLGQLGKAS